MDNIRIAFILIGFILLIVAVYLKYTIYPLKKGKKNKYKKKYHNPNNNFFRNNPQHVDLKHEYIENVWDEITKK